MERAETVIVGGGQAGLAMSYHLRRLGREHVIVERARVAERWRTQRWDSLMFQLPNWSISLPGQSYAGNDPDGFSHKDQIVKFLEDYCESIAAPLRTGVTVCSLRAASRAGRCVLVTDHGEIEARNVVIATGPYQRPKTPRLSSGFPVHVFQIHASDYRNAAALPTGAVLVVGAGASGCQIAEELLEAGRQVYLSVGRHRRVPRRYRGRDVIWWRRALGHLDQTAEATPKDRQMERVLLTGIHGGRDVNLRQLAARGMILLGRLRAIHESRIALGPDLEDNLRAGDQAYDEFKSDVDDYVTRMGIDAPRMPGDADRPRESQESIGEIDVRASAIRSVIWATGYALDLGWVELPIFDALGEPVHRRGITPVPGVYVLGLAWLHKRKSSFLFGVGEDAEYLAERIHRA